MNQEREENSLYNYLFPGYSFSMFRQLINLVFCGYLLSYLPTSNGPAICEFTVDIHYLLIL